MINLPKTLVAELTYSCNHRCIFCCCPWEADASLKGEELTALQWKDAFFAMRQRGAEHVTFTGGEATMRSDLFEILHYAKEAGFSLGLISNGFLVDDEFLNKLKPLDVLLSISVPGIETFAETTGCNNIENVLSIFAKCKALQIRTVANIAVTKKNFGELYENIALPVLNGADYVLLNRFLPGGRGLENKQFLLTIEQMNEMFDTAEEVLAKAGLNGHVGTELPYCAIKNPKKYHHLSISSMCAAAKTFFVIDPAGYIKVCNHSPVRLVHHKDADLLIENEHWCKFISSNYIPKMCHGCKHLNINCDGGCREAAHICHGDPSAPDPCF